MAITVEKSIFTTCLCGKTTPLRTRVDKFNPMTVIIDFDHNLPAGYFELPEETVFAVYIDNEFDHEFSGTTTKIQLQSLDAVSDVDIFALPHSGFRLSLDRETPGNKIRIKFRGKNPDFFDVEAHHIQWDEGSGTFIIKEMGVIDARTGDLISGHILKSSKIIDP